MPAPLVTIYVTSLTSAPKVRKHTELLHRALRGLEIPYEAYDLVNDEEAKRRWQRAKPEGKVIGLPGYLVGGEWIGTMDDFEDAVETQTLETFLKQDMEVADASQTIGEAELDRLMREMTDEDLDQLVGDLTADDIDVSGISGVSGVSEVSRGSGATESEKKDATTPTTGLFSAAAGAVTSAVHSAEEGIKAAVEEVKTAVGEVKTATEEPASVTAAREEVEAEEKGKVAEPKEPKEQTLDDIIDRTLAKEAIEEEKKEAGEEKQEDKEAEAAKRTSVDEAVEAEKEAKEEPVAALKEIAGKE